MQVLQSLWRPFSALKTWFLARSLLVKLIVIAILVGATWLAIAQLRGAKQSAPQYQTGQVEKGTLVVAISASGQISAANSGSVGTQASGVVNRVYVENGQKVQSGSKVAEIDLDLEGKQQSTQAFASYQSAKTNLETAKANLFSTQSDMLKNWKIYMNTAQSSTYQNSDGSPKTNERQVPDFVVSSDDWLATEAKYKNQQNAVAQAQTSLNAAWSAYQQTSPIIYAPISGTVTGISLQIGSVLTAQSGSAGNSTSQKIASIKTDASPTITINLTEVDVPKVKVGNKATLTLDAFPGKTYTGSVISIDTVGAVSSGVTTYPTVIKLDTQEPNIFSNMSVQANIITQVKDDTLIVPVSAVQSQNGQSFVRTMKNGKVSQTSVETGLSSGTQIEIVSGSSEGDVVVTSTITSTGTGQQASNQTQSPFGAIGGGGFRGGGGGGGGGFGGARRAD